MECGSVLALSHGALAFDSGSKLHALHTLRENQCRNNCLAACEIAADEIALYVYPYKVVITRAILKG